MRYGVDRESRLTVAKTIQEIFAGNGRPPQTKSSTVWESRKPKEPPKPTHPFFLGSTARVQETRIPAPHDTRNDKAEERQRTNILRISSPSKASLLSRSSGTTWADVTGSFRKPSRPPGALEAVWPPRGMTRIQPQQTCGDEAWKYWQHSDIATTQRKLKNVSVSIAESDDVLETYRNMVWSLRSQKSNTVDSTTLRKPQRKVMSGAELQLLVAKNVSCSLPGALAQGETSEDEPTSSQPHLSPNNIPMHRGLQHLFGKIPESLTAFDNFECDSVDWVHKYAPKLAEDVLQQGSEAFILKDWLKSLTISAVEGVKGLKRSRDLSATSRTAGILVKKRRKKRAEALDGFVVSSDEEAGQMNEIAVVGELEPAFCGQTSLKRSVVREANLSQKLGDSEKVDNAVVISGPHGCGKTAAVYAVANELGFEIFEINAGSRRSGKDLLDKIGDMIRNHLVNHDQDAENKNLVEGAEDALRLANSVKQEIEAGRQGTMQSFFQPKNSPPKKSRGRPKKKEDVQKAEVKQILRKPKDQKQSVILLEEVDVLFEDDKQFWATTLEVIKRSKRPLIMTCTDESLLPLEDLQLFAILRFLPPPEPLATDYLLLLACNEGHLLSREAVSSLYEAKHNDLRACIAELDFFCQMAIGDTQGGLGWFLIQDTSLQVEGQDKKVLRVVSEGSYPMGIGWLSKDHDASGIDNTLEDDIEVLSELWHGWSLDLATLRDFIDLNSFRIPSQPSKERTLADLEAIGNAYDALSVADIFSPMGIRQDHSTPLDATQPELSERSRANYIDGLTLVQANPFVDQTGMSTSLALSLRALARRLMPRCQSLTLTSVTPLLSSLLQAHWTTPPVTSKSLQTAFSPLKPTIVSSFSAPTSAVTTDVAPFIRSITAFDIRLEEQRRQLENANSDARASIGSKRPRTTRASRAALEGGAKASTRRERWFPSQLDFRLVQGTGGDGWAEAALSQ